MIFMCWMRNFNETSTKRKKLTYKATHSGNNKQDFLLTLAIFDETTAATIKSYYINRLNSATF